MSPPERGEGRPPSLMLAGGGTGGHVLAGVAVAELWRERFPGASIVFVGARGGIEERLVPRAGFRLRLLSVGSLKRVSLGRRLHTLVQLPYSFVRSAFILLSERPRVVLGVGGYASGPLVLTARCLGWLWGARVAILEQNAHPGFTNRMLGRFAHLVLSAFPGVDAHFPGRKVVVTGNPIRGAIQPLASAAGREPFTVFIFGGSQGSVPINSLVLEALGELGDMKGRLRFIHQTGERDYDRVLEGHRRAGTAARVEKFIYDMPAAYAAASLLICRAGSGTLAEIAAVGRAALLVPLPTAADNHQELNARIFSDAGAAVLLVQTGATGASLARLLHELLADPARIAAMENTVKRFSRPDAARSIVDSLLSRPTVE